VGQRRAYTPSRLHSTVQEDEPTGAPPLTQSPLNCASFRKTEVVSSSPTCTCQGEHAKTEQRERQHLSPARQKRPSFPALLERGAYFLPRQLHPCRSFRPLHPRLYVATDPLSPRDRHQENSALASRDALRQACAKEPDAGGLSTEQTKSDFPNMTNEGDTSLGEGVGVCGGGAATSGSRSWSGCDPAGPATPRSGRLGPPPGRPGS
jgi:hypothetical protein